jgi:subtilisin-like proprotein convertase family protein
MKKKNYILFSFVLLLFSFVQIFAQNEQQKAEIVKHYDLKAIQELALSFEKQANINKKNAIEAARVNGWEEFKFNADGSFQELIGLFPNGSPMYYAIDNATAAVSTRTNFLINNYGLTGAGMFVGVWDGGTARVTHQEFGDRALIMNGQTYNGNNFHASHVSGTIAASGINPQAKGMATASIVKSYDWFNDASEALVEVQNGMLVSNHSYGVPIENAPGPWFMGAYSQAARQWDQVAYSSPYYLAVKSAGNSGQTTNTSPTTVGYDKLTGNKNAKNNLVIANAQAANIDSNGNLTGVNINAGSSQGPTDDRRIKPDIAGQGTGLLSTGGASNTEYITLSGTSMSAPNVTGSLLLLQQLFFNNNSRYMRASTLKGLVCHTADDAGNPGPDANFGWGLLNSKRAAEAIIFNGLNASIAENVLAQGQTYTYNVKSDGVNPLIGSITWTDLPGTANNGILNDPTPALVNDLDIRITQGTTTYFPWKLQSNATLNATRSGDNNVDNVEVVRIDAPTASDYIITVTHKGTLQGGPQNYSLIITGLDSSFAISSLSDEQKACTTGQAVYNLNFINGDFSSVTVSATNLPAGVTATFSETVLGFNTPFTLTLSNLTGVAPGQYTINVVGTKGSEVKIIPVYLRVFSNTFTNVSQVYPAANQQNLSPTTKLTWAENSNATSYKVQVSTSNTFATIVQEAVTTDLTFTVTNLAQNTDYFWRVLPINLCGEATTGPARLFKTANLVCNTVYTATNFSNATIGNGFLATASVPVSVPAGFSVGNLVVNFNITHPAVQELVVILQGPASIGSPQIALLNQECTGIATNINVSVSDAGIPLVCSGNPVISGVVKPRSPLNALNNLQAEGVWTLRVADDFELNGGVINSFSLDFCTIQNDLSIGAESTLDFTVYPNPSKGILNIQLSSLTGDSASADIYDVQGRKVASTTITNSLTQLSIDNLTNGVYFVVVNQNNQKTTKKIVLQR